MHLLPGASQAACCTQCVHDWPAALLVALQTAALPAAPPASPCRVPAGAGEPEGAARGGGVQAEEPGGGGEAAPGALLLLCGALARGTPPPASTPPPRQPPAGPAQPPTHPPPNRPSTPPQVRPITDFLSNEEHVKLLKQDKAQNQAFLLKEFQIGEGARAGVGGGAGGGRTEARAAVRCRPRAPPPPARPAAAGPEQVDALYHFAKWNFECGNYSAAAEYLYHYRSLSTNPERTVSSLWGKVAADILLQARAGW